MSDLPTLSYRIADLPNRKPTRFEMAPDEGERALIAQALGLVGLRKLRFVGRLEPMGNKDWRLVADLGATLVQECVVTLEPVVTRIDEVVERTYLAHFELQGDGSEEVEMPEDDSIDPLPEHLDVGEVMVEALSLSLPPYPRAEGAELGESVYTEPGVAPMRDEDARPFAGLAALKAQMEGDQGEG